jgi:Domain of unknown function (DUF1996)
MEASSRLLLAGLAGIALIAGLALLGSSGAAATSGRFAKGSGSFHMDCRFSHRKPDDPIVFPRGPGQSHSHDFLGSRRTDAFAVPRSIRHAATTCERTESRRHHRADRSAYWVPTLYDGASPIDPQQATIWYQTGIRQAKRVRAFPKGLRVIAGNSKGAAADVDGIAIYRWQCEGGYALPGTDTIAPTCKTKRLDLNLKFPDCWDGIHLDSLDHKSHMAYSVRPDRLSTRRVCPSTHPVLMPQITLNVRYGTFGGPLTRLASGAMNTAHGDFMNGWDQRQLKTLVKRCLNADRYCGGQDTPVPGHP